ESACDVLADLRRLIRGEPDSNLAISAPPEGRHNLPVQLTSFVGRGEEIPEIRRLISSARLLTLTGAGGCGKTRLALEVSRGLIDQFPDGVWLVDLASLSEPTL